MATRASRSSARRTSRSRRRSSRAPPAPPGTPSPATTSAFATTTARAPTRISRGRAPSFRRAAISVTAPAATTSASPCHRPRRTEGPSRAAEGLSPRVRSRGGRRAAPTSAAPTTRARAWRDATRATAAWRRGCDEGDGGGCNAPRLGLRSRQRRRRGSRAREGTLREGLRPPRRARLRQPRLDFPGASGRRPASSRAAVLFKQACNQGLDEACARVPAVVWLLKRACPSKGDEACALVKDLDATVR